MSIQREGGQGYVQQHSELGVGGSQESAQLPDRVSVVTGGLPLVSSRNSHWSHMHGTYGGALLP